MPDGVGYLVGVSPVLFCSVFDFMSCSQSGQRQESEVFDFTMVLLNVSPAAGRMNTGAKFLTLIVENKA